METDVAKEIYKILKENYVFVKSIYKYYASMTNTEIFSININCLTLFAKDFKIFDPNLNEVTFNLEIVSVNNGKCNI